MWSVLALQKIGRLVYQVKGHHEKNNGFHCNHRRPYTTFNVGLPLCEYLGLI